jgi:hypothetical protein
LNGLVERKRREEAFRHTLTHERTVRSSGCDKGRSEAEGSGREGVGRGRECTRSGTEGAGSGAAPQALPASSHLETTVAQAAE